MDDSKMKTRVSELAGVRIVECVEQITRVDDALSLIAACREHDADRLLVDSRNLPDAFFELRSLFAGEFIQKFQNYHIRLAVIFAPEAKHTERFEEFLFEAKRGRSFRTFTHRGDAEAWLSADGFAEAVAVAPQTADGVPT